MLNLLKTVVVNGQDQILRDYGAETWAWLCDEFPGPFSFRDAVVRFPLFPELSLTTRRHILRVVIANGRLAASNHPDDAAPIIKRGNLYHWRIPG